MGKETRKAYFFLHISVLLYGFTAILGKLITLWGPPTVFYRMGITLLSLLLIPGIVAKAKAIPPKARWKMAGIGVLVALHWVTFYEAIKYSNASITLATFASTTFFTAIIEPLVMKRRFRAYELLLGGIVLVGLVFISGVSGAAYYKGMAIALLSALLIVYASVLNKQVVGTHSVSAITLIEFVAGFGIMCLVLPLYLQIFPEREWIPTWEDAAWLLVLALLCTTLAYNLTMKALEQVSAFTANLAINMEPVYGILMAAVILQEHKDLNPGFYIGTVIVMSAVLLHPVLMRRAERREAR